MALTAETENLHRSTVSSPPGESSPEAAKAGGWVSGEEFYMYVQPGGPGLTVFMPSYLELLSTTFQFPVLPQGKPLSPFNSPDKAGPYLPCSHPDTYSSVPPSLESPSPPHTYFCSLGLSQILHRLTRRVVQLETVLEGVMTQMDAMGSKLPMLEKKGQLAPFPGMVSDLSPGSSRLPQLNSTSFSTQWVEAKHF